MPIIYGEQKKRKIIRKLRTAKISIFCEDLFIYSKNIIDKEEYEKMTPINSYYLSPGLICHYVARALDNPANCEEMVKSNPTSYKSISENPRIISFIQEIRQQNFDIFDIKSYSFSIDKEIDLSQIKNDKIHDKNLYEDDEYFVLILNLEDLIA